MELSNDELLHAQAHIWNHIYNFVNSMSLKCAIQLGIPDIINNHGGGRPMTIFELVEALPIDKEKANCVSRLMRILVHSGFFVKQMISKNEEKEKEEEGYLLTPASRLLLKDEPRSVTPFLLMTLDPILTKPWDYVSEWFQNDHPTPFEMYHGRTFWEYAGNDPAFSQLFNDAMASDTRFIASVFVGNSGGVLEGLKSLVDVGGGTGTVAKAIADAFPELNCTVLDTPQVVADLAGSKNLSFVGGDMFQAIPTADAVLLKWILHNWNDEECVKILKRCKESIPSKDEGGKVIIIDMIVADNQKGKGNDNTVVQTQLFFDMVMMVIFRGKERNEKEWAQLFSTAGYSDYKITPILGLRSLIEVFP